MVHQCICCLHDLLTQFSNKIRTSSSFAEVSKTGKKLANLTEEADAMFGGIITVEVVINLLNGVCSFFFGIGVTGIYGDVNEVNVGRALFCIAFLVLSVFSLFRIYSLGKCGQNMANVYLNIR